MLRTYAIWERKRSILVALCILATVRPGIPSLLLLILPPLVVCNCSCYRHNLR